VSRPWRAGQGPRVPARRRRSHGARGDQPCGAAGRAAAGMPGPWSPARPPETALPGTFGLFPAPVRRRILAPSSVVSQGRSRDAGEVTCMRTRAGLRKRRALVRRAERGDHELLEVQLVGRVNSAVKHIEVRYQQARRQPVGGRHSGKTGCNVALAGLLTVHGRGPVGGGRCSSRSARVCQLRSSGEMTTTGQHTGTRRDPGEHAMVGDDIMFRTAARPVSPPARNKRCPSRSTTLMTPWARGGASWSAARPHVTARRVGALSRWLAYLQDDAHPHAAQPVRRPRGRPCST